MEASEQLTKFSRLLCRVRNVVYWSQDFAQYFPDLPAEEVTVYYDAFRQVRQL